MLYNLALLNHECEYTKTLFEDRDLPRPQCHYGIEFTDFLEALDTRLAAGRLLGVWVSRWRLICRRGCLGFWRLGGIMRRREARGAIERLVGEALKRRENGFPSDEEILSVVGKGTF